MHRFLRRGIASAFLALALPACRATEDVGRDAATRAGDLPVVDTGTVAVNGTHLFYEVAGEGPVVVLLHGGNLDRRMWDPQFYVFAREHRVVRYDLRGYGRSGPADSSYQSYLDLHALLGALGVGRASLVGLSGGGRVAIDFALEYPGVVDRLILAAPGLSGWKYSAVDTAYFAAARQARDRDDARALGLAWLGSIHMQPAMEHPDLAPQLTVMAAENGKHWMEVLKLGDLEQVPDPPALHRTSQIDAPTLLIMGTRDTSDMFLIADTLGASVPLLERVMFEGAGHLLNMEEPDRFNQLVLGFLRQ